MRSSKNKKSLVIQMPNESKLTYAVMCNEEVCDSTGNALELAILEIRKEDGGGSAVIKPHASVKLARKAVKAKYPDATFSRRGTEKRSPTDGTIARVGELVVAYIGQVL